MITGICPECGEQKEITQSGAMRGYCDDCYSKKYTCDVCGEIAGDEWLWINLEKGKKGHRDCIEEGT